jgi:hypothetical protein
MCQIGLIVEYSRMKVPSLTRGCEIPPFVLFATSGHSVANQKVALSALGKRRMKHVDKDIDKNNKQRFMLPKRRFWKD